jgi:hypothetical protein
VGQDEGSPLLNWQLEERALELVTIGHLTEAVLRYGLVQGPDRDLHWPPSSAAYLVLARVDEESMEPGVEPVSVAKPAQVAPRSDERVLDGVLRSILIAKDPSRDRVKAVICGAREHIECLVVAPLSALDEL